MSMDDETSTNDSVKQRPAEEPKSPEIRVSTQHCTREDLGFDCLLYEPEGGLLRVEPPFVVSIVNGRSLCTGSDEAKSVWWKIEGSDPGPLRPGETVSHTMTANEETLELYYATCGPHEADSHGIPDPGTTPRVTINLIKVRGL